MSSIYRLPVPALRPGTATTSITVAAALLVAFPAFAAEQEPLTLASVVVTATRQATRSNDLIADVTVIDREAVEQSGATTVPELLARQPGLHVVSNGGPGKASSVFMRGTNSGHVLLLVDGIPLGSATSGAASLHNLPLSQIERIEILRGPASSLYGSDALGGVIQVFTRRGEGPPRAHAYAGIGSHGSQEAGAGISGASGPWSYSVGASHLRTNGFNIAADPVRFRTVSFNTPNPDADGYRNSAFSGRLNYRLADGHEIGAMALESTSRSHYDAGGPEVDARNNDRTRVHALHLRNRITDQWTSLLRWGQSEDRSTSMDPGHSLFATRQQQWVWQNDLRLPVGSLMFALEHMEQSVDSTTRYQVRDRRVRSLVLGYQGNLGPHGWQLSLRRDDNSQFGAKTTGAAAYGYRFAEDWQARAAIGTAFKAPSFNQLYFPDYGSPDLKPEEARNREVGINWEHGSQHAAITYFDNRITNLIGGFPVVNVGRARITGTSLAYGLNQGAWTLDSSIDLSRPIDERTGNRLQRRPAEQVKLAFSYAPGPWKAGMEISGVGRRYDTTTQTRAMGGYGLLNLFVSHELGRDLSLEGRLNNLSDRIYENAWAYAVPGREIMVGLRYSPK